jgi:peroxiredoxin
MAERYNPNGKFPLTVLINAQGKVVKEWEGYQPSKEKFIAEIAAITR